MMVGLAHALDVDITVCGELDVSYFDVNSVESELDDDFFLTANDKPARGAEVKITDVTTSVSTYVNLSDANPACITVTLDSSHTYDFRLKAKAKLNGDNTIRVKNNDTNKALYYHQGPTGYWPATPATLTITTGAHPAWDILAAASWALHRRAAGMSDQDLTFYTQGCPGFTGTVSCLDRPTETLYIDPGHDQSKYIIVHEMGHLVALLTNGAGANGGSATADTCDRPTMGGIAAKRSAGSAANEGLAWYYAAIAFNDSGGSDCEILKGGNDFNQDGTKGVVSDHELTPSCEGDPTNESWANLDFIDNECGGDLDDRGTVLDYMRAFWVDQGQGLTGVIRVSAGAPLASRT